MQTAPAVSTPLDASWVYRGFAVLIAIILIAACAYFTLTSGSFTVKNGLMCALTLVCSAWLLWDAFRPVRGALHFAAGQWVLAQGDIEYAGTITPRLDLQHYLLVYFETTTGKQGTQKNTWLHLERRRSHKISGHAQDWFAIRRAVFARPSQQLSATTNTAVTSASAAGAHEH